MSDSPLPNRETNQLNELILNTIAVSNALLASRAELAKKFSDPRRDIADECGHPPYGDTNAWDYQDLYDREAVATRVVEVLPKESWQIQPILYEDESADTTTLFERAFKDLGKNLDGEESWFEDDQGNPVWEYLQRADILSGIGQFGALLLGINDGRDLREPVLPTEYGSSNQRELLFLRCFPESLVQISQFDEDTGSSRYGQPVVYSITFNDPRESNRTGMGLTTATQDVHWSRIIHIADNRGSSEVFGVPRMQPVLNRLLDLRKLYGGSAEMYWRGAFPGISLETHPALGGDVEIDRQATKDMMENYMNGLQRYLALMGMSAKSMAPQVVDPTPQINRQIEAICIRIGIPKRVFMGSERGELASTQDDAAWNDSLRGRQRNYVTPKIVKPFINRLIKIGVLPKPKRYCIYWPDLTSQTMADKAAIALSLTQAMSQYVQSNVEALITPLDYITEFLGVPDQKARSMMKNSTANLDEPLLGQTRLKASGIDLNPAPKTVSKTP